MAKNISVTIATPRKRTRTVPRSAFKAGEPNPHAFVKGKSGNPSGRVKDDHRRLLSKSLRIQLADRVPDGIAQALQLSEGSSWGQAVARSLLIAAVKDRDVAAIRTIAELSEDTLRSRVEFGAMTDEDGNMIPPPSLNVVFVSPAQPDQGHYLDRTTPALPLPPLNCRID